MKVFDTETYLITRHTRTPRLVCLTVDDELTADVTADQIERLIDGPGLLVGHNVSFDLGVLAEHHFQLTGSDWALRRILDKIEAEQISDTQIREQLIRIATGELKFVVEASEDDESPEDGFERVKRTLVALDACVWRYFRHRLPKKDTWRLRYSELDGVPVDEWPPDAIEYARSDVRWTRDLWHAQAQVARRLDLPYGITDGDFIVSEARETAAAFALHMMSCVGLRTERVRVESTLADWSRRSEVGREIGKQQGWIRTTGPKSKHGTVDQKALRARIDAAYGGKAPKTPKGATRTATSVLRESGDKVLEEYAESLSYTSWGKRYGPILQMGTELAICSSPNVLVESGRTSWRDPPYQQPPREGGFRECHVPRPGWLYCSADYDFQELCTLAQVCLWTVGYSRLADTINSGLDPHLVTAVSILNAEGGRLDYAAALALKNAGDKRIKHARQSAKAVNFGFPGRLGPRGFQGYAKSTYNLDISEERASELKTIWLNTYNEMYGFFSWVDRQIGGQFGDRGTIRQFVSERVRGSVEVPAACNSFFQGLAADASKYANWILARAAYSGEAPDSAPADIREACRAYRGARPVLFLHDEIIAEVPEDRFREMALAQGAIMEWSMRLHCPDVRPRAKPVITRRWLKGVDPTYDDRGNLIVTEER